MSSSSSWLIWRTGLAGTPMTSQPDGTILPGGTSAPAPTCAHSSTTAPFRTTAPMPMRTLSRTVQACTTARWPIVTFAPTMQGYCGVTWSTEQSWTLLLRPIVTKLSWSPRTTVPGQMLAPASIATSPMTCAAGSTYASGWTRGLRPGTSRITGSDRGDGGDLHQVLRRGELRLHRRPRRRVLRIHPGLPGGVHLVIRLHVGQIHRRREQLALVAAGLRQQRVDLLEDLRGLSLDVGGVAGHLAGDVDGVPGDAGGAETRTHTETPDAHERSSFAGCSAPAFIPEGRHHRFVNAGSGPMTILWVYNSTDVTRTFVATGETVPHLSPRDLATLAPKV